MNKSLTKILIIIWSIIALSLCTFLIYAINNHKGAGFIFKMGTFSSKATKIQKEESLILDNCDTIDLDLSSADLIVSSTDDTNLKVIQRSNKDLDDDHKFTVSKEGNSLFIKENKNISFSLFNFYNDQIEIYIPKSYAGNLTVNSSSGETKILSDMNLNNINITQSSGDLRDKNSINAKQVNLKLSSGDIDLTSLICNTYDIQLSSGDLDIDSLAGSGDIHASSGDIKVTYKDIDKYSKVSANSGDIKIAVPRSLSFEFNGHCSSGDIDSSFPLNYNSKDKHDATAKIGNDPSITLDVNTSSGDINISQ